MLYIKTYIIPYLKSWGKWSQEMKQGISSMSRTTEVIINCKDILICL